MKKRSKRQWFIPVFEDGVKLLGDEKKFPVGIFAFDNFSDAYNYAASLRLSPMRDEDGELVLDENGLAKLPPFGRVSVIEIDGKKLDWKRIESVSTTFHLKGMNKMHDAIELGYEYPFNKNSIRSIKEETDEFYDRSTLVKEA